MKTRVIFIIYMSQILPITGSENYMNVAINFPSTQTPGVLFLSLLF